MVAAAGLEREARSGSDVRCSIAPERGGASIIGGTAGIVVGVMAASTAGVTVTVESVAAERHAAATLARSALSAVAQRPAAGRAALVPAPLMRLAQMCRTFQKSSVRRAVTAMPRCMPGASRPVPWGLSCRPLPGTARASVTRGQWKRGRSQTPRPSRDRPPALTGRTTVALNPPSARFCSRISPPWPRMLVQAMARPRPAPPVVAAPRLVEPDAGLEHPLQIGLRDAWTVVLNDDEHTSVVVRDSRRCPDAVGARILQQVAGGRGATPRAGMPPAPDWRRARQVRGRDPGGRRPCCRSTHSRSTVRVPSCRMSSRMNASDVGGMRYASRLI